MSNPTDGSVAASPFHAGELAVQTRAGSRERMAQVGPRVIRNVLPQQHREFFALLPFIALGAADDTGQPWATLLAGAAAGFVTSPDDTHLRVEALPPDGDPMRPLIRDGAPLALLGIELPTRRRNRANGRVVDAGKAGFGLRVMQSFGNCPKYIQRRELQHRAGPPPEAVRRTHRLDATAAALIHAADTFFIATHAAGDAPSAGSDVSHRGGRPGFTRASDDGRTLTWPDYPGNTYFNTLGNLAVEPRTGLVFPDFANGDLLHVAGRAEIIWDGPALAHFAGAERLVRLHIDQVLYRPEALPLRWRLVEPSPELQRLGK
ncbi:MAG: pyridoxamine 5'-phosphate oxidase family protein [Gemmatimonadota bacterium]